MLGKRITGIVRVASRLVSGSLFLHSVRASGTAGTKWRGQRRIGGGSRRELPEAYRGNDHANRSRLVRQESGPDPAAHFLFFLLSWLLGVLMSSQS